jgi:endonuclease/exonuclease/phosphatase family metal-dependent hydrolase
LPRFSWILCCVLITSITHAAEAADHSIVIRVLSYNIKHGEGVDGKVDLSRAARIIKSVSPDLVALQEVDSGTKRTAQVDQPKVLGELTGMQVVFGDNIPYQGGRYGNAVLSRLPIVRTQNHRLPSFYNGEQRGLFEIEVRPPGSKSSFLFFATHLDYRPQDHERVASASLINELVASRGDIAALLVGDLNSEPESRPMKELGQRWKPTATKTMLTFPSPDPVKQIDYVLYYPARRWCVLETKVLDERRASDHRPVLAVLKFCPPSPSTR